MSRYLEETYFNKFVEFCIEETVVIYIDRLLLQVDAPLKLCELFYPCDCSKILELLLWMLAENLYEGRDAGKDETRQGVAAIVLQRNYQFFREFSINIRKSRIVYIYSCSCH